MLHSLGSQHTCHLQVFHPGRLSEACQVSSNGGSVLPWWWRYVLAALDLNFSLTLRHPMNVTPPATVQILRNLQGLFVCDPPCNNSTNNPDEVMRHQCKNPAPAPPLPTLSKCTMCAKHYTQLFTGSKVTLHFSSKDWSSRIAVALFSALSSVKWPI